MNLVDLLNIANAGYGHNELVDDFYNPVTGEIPEDADGRGDSLALYIVRELKDTFDPNATDDAQLAEADRIMQEGIHDLQDVRKALVGARVKLAITGAT